MSHEQKHPILQKLEEYLKNTPKEQLDEDWLDILKNSDMEAYYEKKYKDALERAKKLQETCNSTAVVGWCEYLFPELKESKDERIRKELIEQVAYITPNNDELDDELNTLPTYQKRIDKYRAWLEKQGEQKPYGQRKKCFDCQFNYAGECKGYCALKRNEQPTDKVEPKFKVGDWLQYRYAEPFLVEEITEQGYCNGNSCLPFEWEDEIHLWAIQDAKDGDVLVASDGSIFLFAGVDGSACKYYVAIATDNHVEINKETKGGYWETSRAVYPATKEQRDKLEKAMLNAGYKWNKEELKLEKI